MLSDGGTLQHRSIVRFEVQTGSDCTGLVATPIGERRLDSTEERFRSPRGCTSFVARVSDTYPRQS